MNGSHCWPTGLLFNQDRSDLFRILEFSLTGLLTHVARFFAHRSQSTMFYLLWHTRGTLNHLHVIRYYSRKLWGCFQFIVTVWATSVVGSHCWPTGLLFNQVRSGLIRILEFSLTDFITQVGRFVPIVANLRCFNCSDILVEHWIIYMLSDFVPIVVNLRCFICSGILVEHWIIYMLSDLLHNPIPNRIKHIEAPVKAASVIALWSNIHWRMMYIGVLMHGGVLERTWLI